MHQLPRENRSSGKRQVIEFNHLPVWKRALDIYICCMALPILAIGTFWVAVLMSIAAPGPIFFRQERVGLRGKRFRMFKFRTMHVGADTASHQFHVASLMTTNAPMQKLDFAADSRLIPGGWLLRASGLDELPQIINVLRGEMSIIGPRPCIPYEYEIFSTLQRRRFQCLPGLTGLWQVSGKNRTTFDKMIQLDIEYSSRMSLLFDLKILFLTVPTIIGQVMDMCAVRKKCARILQPEVQSADTSEALHSSAQSPAAVPVRPS